jgi:tetraacyldisaccharide 4'-kinase
MPDNAGIRGWLARSWYGGRAQSWLAPLAMLFAAASSLRRFAYRRGLFASVHPGVPVIVVGNLTVGGTGKTPLVIWLAQHLQQRGLRVGVALRGYGGRATAPQLVTAASDPAAVGDEAVLIAGRADCLVAVGRRRAAVAAMLVSRGCQVVLSDDGLQHLALQRDLEIVVIDGMRGLGNRQLLPQGPLRESPGRLRSVAAVVINGSDATGLAAGIAAPYSMAMAAEGLHLLASDTPVALDALRGAVVHAVAATGNPERFFALLRTLGCRPVEHAFADHHAFRAADLAFADELPIVMTEKDAVKCRAFGTDRMQYLKVSAWLPDEDAARLLQLVQDCITKGARIHA